MNNPSSQNKPLGAFLRERRLAMGIPVRRLSDMIADIDGAPDSDRVSPAYLSDIENSRRAPSDKALRLICTVLKLTEADIEPYDARVPSKDMQDLATANMKYGIAFRRMVSMIHQQNLSPDDLLKRFSPPSE